MRVLRLPDPRDPGWDEGDKLLFLFRSVLLRASVMNALVMIQPALLSYSLNQQGPPQPVLLDAQALKVSAVKALNGALRTVICEGTRGEASGCSAERG